VLRTIRRLRHLGAGAQPRELGRSAVALRGRLVVCAAAVASILLVVQIAAEGAASASVSAAATGSGRGMPSAPIHSGAPVECDVAPAGSSADSPVLVAVGASFTAGVGAARPQQSWAVRLAELLSWRAVIIGVPGAGYVNRGDGDFGPVSDELARLDLATLDPALVIVQAGHDDWRASSALETRRVKATVRSIEAGAPGAQVALLSVFGASGATSAAELRVDTAIVTAARSADPLAIVLDPLRNGWTFARSMGFHPTGTGALTIAHLVETSLASVGIVPTHSAGRASVSCSALGAVAGHSRTVRASAHRPS
jgi:acyl-CoA thioesterase-1